MRYYRRAILCNHDLLLPAHFISTIIIISVKSMRLARIRFIMTKSIIIGNRII